MCSDTKRLEMLIFSRSVHFTCRMISVTGVLVTLRLSYRAISPESCFVTYLSVNLILNRSIHRIVCMLYSILNPQGFTRRFYTSR